MSTENDKSGLKVIAHSFFVIPFLIAVFCVLLIAAVRLLTLEPHTVYDYLEDIKIGSLTKRWQAAFELSKILSNPAMVPQEDRFYDEMIAGFEQAKHDDDRIRQYLALAMGRTGSRRFTQPLLESLPQAKEDNLPAIIYALGMLRDKDAVDALHEFVEHPDARLRLATVIALGNIGDIRSIPFLKNTLHDREPNVQWDSAVALAKMGDSSGREVLSNLMTRGYFANFPQVDIHEQDHVIQVAIQAAAALNDPALNRQIEALGHEDPNMNVRKAAMEALDTP